MANSLYNALNQGGQNPNFFQMLRSFQQFRQSFSGNPRQQVENLLATGQMTQQQYNQLSQMAQQFMNFIK